MLFVGIVIRNIGVLYDFVMIVPQFSAFLRKFAFLIILLRGGMGLDAEALKKLKVIVCKASSTKFLGCMREIINNSIDT